MLDAGTYSLSTQPRKRLAEERYRRGWSQENVAHLLQTTRLTIGRWEHGLTTPGPYFQSRLCELFDLSAAELGLIPAPWSLPPSDRDAPRRDTGSAHIDPAFPLPSTPIPLIGRNDERTRLKQGLLHTHPMAFSALYGLPGIGKTALALDLLYDPEIQADFHDGILWAALGPSPDIAHLLKRWGDFLGISTRQAAPLTTREARAKALQTIIGRRKLLVVLDDVWQMEDALACAVGGPNCAYLLTTRFPQLALSFSSGQAMQLCELDDQRSLHLLQRLAPAAVAQEPALAQSLAQAVGGLPLALTLMGNAVRSEAHDGQPRRIRAALARLLHAGERLRLAEPRSILERSPGLPSSLVSLQATIALSEQRLDEQARRSLRALAQAFRPRPDIFSEEDALNVCHESIEALDALSDAGLLQSAGADHYTLHPTIADYARFVPLTCEE